MEINKETHEQRFVNSWLCIYYERLQIIRKYLISKLYVDLCSIR